MRSVSCQDSRRGPILLKELCPRFLTSSMVSFPSFKSLPVLHYVNFFLIGGNVLKSLFPFFTGKSFADVAIKTGLEGRLNS